MWLISGDDMEGEEDNGILFFIALALAYVACTVSSEANDMREWFDAEWREMGSIERGACKVLMMAIAMMCVSGIVMLSLRLTT